MEEDQEEKIVKTKYPISKNKNEWFEVARKARAKQNKPIDLDKPFLGIYI